MRYYVNMLKRKTRNRRCFKYKRNKRKRQRSERNVTLSFLNGHNIETIAEKLCLKPSEVYKKIKSYLKHYTPSRSKNKHLTYIHRRFIEFMHREGMSNSEMARRLNCSKSTIANELKRINNEDAPYSAEEAQADYKEKQPDRREPKKLEIAKVFLEDWVKCYREDKETPHSFYMRTEGDKYVNKAEIVCPQTIYNYINKGYLEINSEDMPMMGKRRKKEKEYELKKGKHTQGASIDERPPVKDAKGLYIFLNWEIDCVCGKKGGPVILTLIEKKTRLYIIRKIPSQTSECVEAALREIFKEFDLPPSIIFETITADNGSEFLQLYQMPELKGRVYYCHPGAPKERAQNERHNGILRKFIPKGSDIADYSDEDIRHFENAINSMFRVALGGNCSSNLFLKEMDKLWEILDS